MPDSFDCRLTFCVPGFGADDVAVPSQDPARLIGSIASVFVDVGQLVLTSNGFGSDVPGRDQSAVFLCSKPLESTDSMDPEVRLIVQCTEQRDTVRESLIKSSLKLSLPLGVADVLPRLN